VGSVPEATASERAAQRRRAVSELDELQGRSPLGSAARGGEICGLSSSAILTGLPRAALMASPAVWKGDDLVAAPVAKLGPDWDARIVTPFTNWLLSH